MEDRRVSLYIGYCPDSGYSYFGKSIFYHTKEELQKNYWGSGPDWIKHYHQFGEPQMDVYWSGMESDVKEIALEFSRKNKIVSSPMWLNKMEETGLGGGWEAARKNSGSTIINNGMIQKRPPDKDLIYYVSDGWKIGVLPSNIIPHPKGYGKGSSNNNSSIYEIYESGVLIHQISGEIVSYCKSNGISYHHILRAVNNNAPVKLSKTHNSYDRLSFMDGWIVKKIKINNKGKYPGLSKDQAN